LLTIALTGLASLGPAPADAAAGPANAPAGGAHLAVPQPIVGINSVVPPGGSMQGGFAVTVTGVGFVPGQTSVRICNVDIPPTGVQVNTAGNTLVFTAPLCTAEQTQLLVTTPTGSASTVFVYEAEGALPVTGSPMTLPITAGAGSIVIGGLALLLTRRRSPRPGRC
jgi:LPXTG-motif cell wall-anchored protein